MRGHVYCDDFVYQTLKLDSYEFKHKFYMIKNFISRMDGILGQNFLTRF